MYAIRSYYGFLEKETLEQKIGEYLAEKEDDLAAWFSSPEIRQRMAGVLDKAVDDLRITSYNVCYTKLLRKSSAVI